MTLYRTLAFFFLLLSNPILAKLEDTPYLVLDPSPSLFSVCSNHGCDRITVINGFDHEWSLVRRHFLDIPPNNAQAERERISTAIGMLEILAGRYAGTLGDRGRNSFFVLDGRTDCEDESMNTTTYLKMMDKEGLLKYHKIGQRQYRFPPHFTATIREIDSDRLFAVDSWFLDNGVPAIVIPYQEWKNHWQPTKSVNQTPLEIANLPNLSPKVRIRIYKKAYKKEDLW